MSGPAPTDDEIRLAILKRKLMGRNGKLGFSKNVRMLRAEIARLEAGAGHGQT